MTVKLTISCWRYNFISVNDKVSCYPLQMQKTSGICCRVDFYSVVLAAIIILTVFDDPVNWKGTRNISN